MRPPLASIRASGEALANGAVENPAERERGFLTAQHDIRSLSALSDDLLSQPLHIAHRREADQAC